MHIGIIDSGIGGKCLLESLEKSYQNYSFTLIMDHSLFPYGNKSKAILLKRISDFVEVLQMRKVSLIILACNTISALILNDLQKKFSLPIKGIIEPTIDYLTNHNIQKVFLIATSNTINSRIYQESFQKKQIDYFCLEHPLLIQMIEEGKTDDEILAIIKELNINDVEAIVLGCTHFIKVKHLFAQVFNVRIIAQDEILELEKGSITILSL